MAILIGVMRAKDPDTQHVEPKGKSLPGFVKRRLVFLHFDRPETTHSRQVVNSVHLDLSDSNVAKQFCKTENSSMSIVEAMVVPSGLCGDCEC
jgi:hypothetical protein